MLFYLLLLRLSNRYCCFNLACIIMFIEFTMNLLTRKCSKYSRLFHELVVLLLTASQAFADISCQGQEDCNNKNAIVCGICAANQTHGADRCIFPFTSVYKDSVKCAINDNCDRACSNKGTCQYKTFDEQDIYLPYCICQKGFYGNACEHTVTKDKIDEIPTIHKITFHTKISPAKMHYQNYYNLCVNTNRKFTVVRVTIKSTCEMGYMYYIYVHLKPCQYSEGGKSSYFNVIFPYKPLQYDNSNPVLTLGNKVLGYISYNRVIIESRDLVVRDINLPLFVSYDEANLICVPIIKFSGCSSSKDNPPVLSRSNRIRITSKVLFIANGKYVNTSFNNPMCEKKSNFHWEIRNTSNDAMALYLEYYNVKGLFFKSYSLPIALYKVLLEVDVVQEEPSRNLAYCYFKIAFINLVATIEGGSEITINKNYGLILRATNSYDPNMPSNQQNHLKIKWKCVDISRPNTQICDAFSSFPVSSSYIVPPEKLLDGGVYNITLTVWTDYYNDCLKTKVCQGVIPRAYANAIINVSNKTDEGEDYIYIKCLLNCNSVVILSQKIYLKVITNSGSKRKYSKFKWTYYSTDELTEKDTGNITVGGLPSFMLLVKENTLSSGKSYVVIVNILDTTWSAKYTFRTQKEDSNGNCSLAPTYGTRGLTLFHIVCENFSSSSIYEFYDKTEREAGTDVQFNGRMLGTSMQSQRGELQNFRVTRGQVLVYITDTSGTYTRKQFTVNLTQWEVTEEDIKHMYKNLTELLTQGETATMLEYISTIPDIVPQNTNKQEVLIKLLNFITRVPTDTLSDIKLTTSTTYNVLLGLNNPVQLAIEPNLMKGIIHSVKNQTRLFSTIVSEEVDLKGMTPKEITTVATYQLNCLHSALMCKDPRTIRVNEFDYNFKTLDELIDSSNFAKDVIYSILNILTFLQAPGQPPTNISAENNSFVLWVMTNDEEYDVTNYLNQYKDIPLSVSKTFTKEIGTELKRNEEDLALRVAAIQENIFWWSKSDIQSHLVSVSFAKHAKRKPLTMIKYVNDNIMPHIQIHLHPGLHSKQVSGIAAPYSSTSKCELDTDLLIEIHRLDPMPKSQTLIRFLYPQTNGSLKVHVHKDYRPDCQLMKTSFEIITHRSPAYSPPIISHEEDPTFYYIGIVPMNNESVAYTFEVNTTVCQFWERGGWSSHGCKISLNKTNSLEAHCACNHFSIFAAAFPVPPQEIDLFSDIKLFLNVFQNPLVVSFVIVVLLIFLIGCFWAWCKDKTDRQLKNVIVLDDNFFEDPYPYLMAVYTSSRFNAGTTAHVGIKIKGSLASSRSHILSSKQRKVLKRNYDDWFLIYSPVNLGDLQSIHLWHDNAGSSPDWFCDKIIVYDLTNNSEVIFVVEHWIALRLTYFPEAIVQGAPTSKVNTVKRIFLDNCILGLREGHTLLTIILRHPRSEITRLQRICVLMCCIISSMLCSIMFYSPGTPIDYNEYSVRTRDIYISIESLAISLIITFAVLFTFKRSYKHSRSKTTDQASLSKDFVVRNKEKGSKSVYSSFVRLVTKSLKGHPLVPAQLEQSKPIVTIRKKWYFVAWTLCISVILICSFFIMLYGLKLGPVKSKKWLSSIVLTLSGEFFFTSPAKIILFSIILSLAFQKMCEMDNHQVSLQDVNNLKPTDYEEQIQMLLIKRNHPMYTPISSDTKKEMMRIKELWSNWWTLIDFTVALCFIFVVSMVVFELWSSHYYTNNRVLNIMTETHNEFMGPKDFFCMEYIHQVEYYLQNTFFRALYNTFWYNKKPIKEDQVGRDYWAEDYTHTLVGHQRVRQVRVLPVGCSLNYFTTTKKCIPHYSNYTEDTDDYGARWKTARLYDIKKTNSPWKYTRSSSSVFSTMYRLCGKSGWIFHDGGYMTHFGPTRAASETIANEMESNEWQDQLTRAVFVEFTLFNINMNLFSQVTIIVEYLIAGKIQLKTNAFSVDSKMVVSFWNALFIVFVVYYIFRSGYLINRQGLLEYITSSSRNRSRLLIVLFGVLSILCATAHYLYSTAYYKSFINQGYGDTYFQFDKFYYYFRTLQMVLSILLCIAIVRTIFIFRGGRTILNYFYALTTSIFWIYWLTLIFFVFLFVQVPMIFLLNIFSFYTVDGMVLNFKCTQYCKSRGFELKYQLIFFVIKSLLISMFMSLYIVLFMYYKRTAQTFKLRKSDKFNIVTFFFNEIKKLKTNKINQVADKGHNNG